MVIDFDKIDAEEAKRNLSLDKHTLVCFISPSGKGVKVVVRITNPERHRDHYRSIMRYYDANYGLEVDSTGINESRACFFSYDEALVYRDDAEAYGSFLTEKADNSADRGKDSRDYGLRAVEYCLPYDSQSRERKQARCSSACVNTLRWIHSCLYDGGGGGCKGSS